MRQDHDESIVEDAYAWLRGETTGELRFDENIRPIRYIVAPDGRLVAPVMVAMLQSVDTVLYVPEYAEGAMEIQVTLDELDDSSKDGALTDRWRIHHGEPEDVRWAWMEIDCAKFKGHFIDGEALSRDNPLAADEPRICRHMNQEHVEDLAMLCTHFGGGSVEQPLMVAIDPWGIDVKRRFDVLRVPAIELMKTAEDAKRVLTAMVEQARQAKGDQSEGAAT